MKIALVASPGGHLTEIEKIIPESVTGNNEVIIITERSTRTEKLIGKKYLLKTLENNPLDYIPALFQFLRIIRKEKVDLIITTGAQIGLPAVIAGKILFKKTIFIESITRPETPTLAGKFCYPFSDIFLVQNPGMEKNYGKRAKYVGGII